MTRPRRSFRIAASWKAGAFTAAAFAAAALVGPRLHWGVWASISLILGFLAHLLVKETIALSLRTAQTVIEAIRNKDYSHRARYTDPGDPLAQLLSELSGLGAHLQREHLRVEETTTLLQAIAARTEIALLAFDDAGTLRWTNAAAERLFQIRPSSPANAQSLGIAEWFNFPSESIVSVPGQALERSWELRRGTFWLERRRYVFFMVGDLRRVRREHERIAWQRLIRVIGHELNNTLTPIQSLASTCLALVREDPQAAMPNVARALSLIEQRAGRLQGFIAEYARLARLPPLKFGLVRLQDCIRVAVELEHRGSIQLLPGPEVMLEADPAQLEQALVNLLRNAVEAVLVTAGKCSISWVCADEDVLITLLDEGPGIPNPENLFVPFFSTKPGGSGVGLALSRNIIESHGGELTIANRTGQRGCIVHIRLPLVQSEKPYLGTAGTTNRSIS